MKISGQMRETRLFGENLLLKRKIFCPNDENQIWLHDCIENNGFKREPLMLLYHFNMGYPLLDEDAVLLSPSKIVTPRDTEAAKGCDSWQNMQPPTPDYAEQVFYHDLKTDENGETCIAIVNHRLDLAVAFSFCKTDFFNLTQWKQMGEGEYVLGIEPCNCYVGGRLDPRNKDIMTYLEPGESKEFFMRIEFVTGSDNIRDLEQKINSYM
jgi:hypothetical protein